MRTSTLRALGSAIKQHYEPPPKPTFSWPTTPWPGVKLTTEIPAETYRGFWDEEREELGEVISFAELSGENMRLMVSGSNLDLGQLPETLTRFKEVLERLEIS